MSANVTVPPSDGGSPTGLPGDRVMRGTIARWASSTGWVDRDTATKSPILDHTKPVKPVTVGELIADELPPWA